MVIGLSGVQFSLYSRGSLFQLIFCGLKGGPLFGGGQLLEMGSYLRKPGMQHSSSNAVLPFRYIGTLINTQIQVS